MFNSTNLYKYLYIYIIFFIFLYVLYCLLIPLNFYPDYSIIKERYTLLTSEVLLSPQGIIFIISNFFMNENYLFNLNLISREMFSLITLIFIFTLVNYIHLLNNTLNLKFEKINLIFFFLTLSSPSCLFGITAFSPEASFTVLSCLFIIYNDFKYDFKNKFLLLFILFIYGFFIDRGNFWVLFFFISGGNFLFIIRRQTSLNFFVILVSLLCGFFLIWGKAFLLKIGMLIDDEKIKGLFYNIDQLGLGDLSYFDIAMRYTYFWLSVLTLPIPDKKYFISLSSFIIYFFLLFSFYRKYREDLNIRIKLKENFLKQENQVILLWLFLFPLMMIIIFPTHAYGKYLFCFSYFIIRTIHFFLGIKKCLLFTFCISFVPLLEFVIKKYSFNL